MNELKFTPEQEAAVKHRGSALLVSAAAGSGKTKVLVERLLDRIEGGDSIDEFLVITYTRAAASELRERIHDELLNRIAENTDNRRLRRQSRLCSGARIGTIHSFCADLLRENAFDAEISPDFRVMDENESDTIKASVLEAVLEKTYETIETSDGFRALVDATMTGRDDRRLITMILDSHKKLQSNPAPQKWIEEQTERLKMHGVSDISETVWGEYLINKTRKRIQFWRDETERLREKMKNHPDFDNAYGPGTDSAITNTDMFLAALDKGWDSAQACGKIEFPRVNPVKGYDDLKNIRKKCKAELEKCAGVFTFNSAEHIEDMNAVAPAITALLQLILDFSNAYSEEKRAKGLVDFSDLEQLAFSLLVDSETGERTETARAISRRFKEIMVDEYQDVNAIQELIINAVSQEGKNIFMVGDVKQSIYRFRLADPTIFLGKYRSAAKQQGREQDLSLILLSKNFRSRAGILDFVNLIFGSIMSEEFGEMDYTEREMLIPGRGGTREQGTGDRGQETGDRGQGAAVELIIIDLSRIESGEDEENPDKIRVEAGFIAERISELVDGGYSIPDGQGGFRRIGYSDIAILLRSVSGKAWQYAGVLSEYGIPVDTPGSEGFFETVEVSAAISLLSVIDNPMQDIPLAAVLRGPIYGFTADELAEIRAQSQGTDYHSALIKAAETNDKCAAFLEEIDSLRMMSPDMSAFRFIRYVYDKTGLPERVGAGRGGNKRRNNLMLLAEYARRFEQNGYKGLFGFLTYIRSLQDEGLVLAGYDAAISDDVVQIMSVHKSKGLEFPVVFLADTSKHFNYKDIQKPLVLHPEFGVGLRRIDRQRRIEYPTISGMAVQSKLKTEMLAEELRVLYVAMTRAREKLIITAALKDAGKQKPGDSGKIAPEILEDIKHPAGWILAALNTAPSRSAPLLRVENGESQNINPLYAGGGGVDAVQPKQVSPYVEVLDAGREFVYPHGRAPELPSKLTVTELKGRFLDAEVPEDAEIAVFAGVKEASGRRFDLSNPGFIREKTGLTTAERGTALHIVMQHIDFSKSADEEAVAGEILRLTNMGFLSKEQADSVDVQKITRFFGSGIGMRLINAENVRREFKFSLLCPAERFFSGGGEDSILLQGVVDCFFEEDGELVVVDFKTDRVSEDTLADRTISYTPQLMAYSDALERITGKHVKERVIYFLTPDVACSV